MYDFPASNNAVSRSVYILPIVPVLGGNPWPNSYSLKINESNQSSQEGVIFFNSTPAKISSV